MTMIKTVSGKSTYLGDSVYIYNAPTEGLYIYTDNGNGITNRIYLNLEVYENLIKFAETKFPEK